MMEARSRGRTTLFRQRYGWNQWRGYEFGRGNCGNSGMGHGGRGFTAGRGKGRNCSAGANLHAVLRVDAGR